MARTELEGLFNFFESVWPQPFANRNQNLFDNQIDDANGDPPLIISTGFNQPKLVSSAVTCFVE